MSLMSCVQNAHSVPDLAYNSQLDITNNPVIPDHHEWNTLLQKHVSTNGGSVLFRYVS